MAERPRHLAPSASHRRRRLTLAAVAALVVATMAGAAVVDLIGDDAGEPVVPVVASDVSASTDTTAAPTTEATTVPPTTVASTTTTEPRGELGSGETVTIAFAGDSYFEGALRTRLDTDPATAVGPFAEVLSRADLAVANLETALGTGGTPAPKDFVFLAPATAVDALRAAGVDVASMANNHGMDHGEIGLQQSLAIKRAQPDGFLIGIGEDEDEAFAPYTTEVKGQRISVIAATQVLDSSLLDYWTAGPDKFGLASAKRVDRLVVEVERARAVSDTVVVFLHWGIETHTCPSGDQQALAQALVDAGADIIVGGHAHRVQSAGRLGDALVGYGLGNFLFKENSAEGARTGVLEVDVTGRRIDGYRWVPGRVAGSVPHPLEGAEADEALAHWNELRGCTNLAA
jgi:poly-gamma-glutamate capsule biosynthesis protein CapA/YwtB (metallophosphatase superfamily)